MTEKFNYAVGHYWDETKTSVGTYNYFGEVTYGTMYDAEDFLRMVKLKSPDKEWKIFKLVELDAK